MGKTSSYRKALLESLADPKEASLYLNAVQEDYPEGLLKALRNVAQAKRQMSKVAEEVGVQRESLYRALSDEGNPTWDTLRNLFSVLRLKIKFESVDVDEHSTPATATGVSITQLHSPAIANDASNDQFIAANSFGAVTWYTFGRTNAGTSERPIQSAKTPIPDLIPGIVGEGILCLR